MKANVLFITGRDFSYEWDSIVRYTEAIRSFSLKSFITLSLYSLQGRFTDVVKVEFRGLVWKLGLG